MAYVGGGNQTICGVVALDFVCVAMPPVRCSSRISSSRRHARRFCCEVERRQVVQRHVLVCAKRVSEAEEKEAVPTLNPVELGRRSRQAIEDAWYQVTRLSTPRASFTIDDDLGAGIAGDDLQPPQAPFTRVLVVGGTGRVGRIVVRKLLLRGYPVRVMCRDFADDAAQNLPASTELVKGDVGNIEDCIKAAKGVDKVRFACLKRSSSACSVCGQKCLSSDYGVQIIYCATSKLQMTGDINKVDHVGVSHIARAWVDTKFASASKAKTETKATKRKIADFKKEVHQESWDLLHVGPLDREVGYHGQDIANALITEDNQRLCFTGTTSYNTSQTPST